MKDKKMLENKGESLYDLQNVRTHRLQGKRDWHGL